MPEPRTVGEAMDLGVEWWQFADAAWDGEPLFNSPEEAEAHRGDLLADWDDEEYDHG